MKKVDLKITLLLTVLTFLGGLFLVPYQFNNLKKTMPEQYETVMATLPLPYNVLIIVSALQLAVITFILAYIGIKLARKTGFKLPILDALFKKEPLKIDGKGALLAVLFGSITALSLIGGDRFIFQQKISIIAETEVSFSFIGLIAGVFYGGIFEEIMLRLFFMSLLIWLIMKIVRKSNLSAAYYWVAIVISTLLFAAGHLPATVTIFGELTPILIIRSFLLNGIGSIFFAYLYWKKGFEYGVMAHMLAHITMQLVFIPIFY